MQKHWRDYQKDFEYATDIDFDDSLEALEEIVGINYLKCKKH